VVRRLTDADLAEIRRLAAAGVPQNDIAVRFGVTGSHVSRLVNGNRRAAIDDEPGPVRPAVEAFSASLDLDLAGQVRAATAVTTIVLICSK
jgi:hypothetical protein